MSEDSPEVAGGSTVQELFEYYAERFATLHQARPSLVFARNHEFCPAGTVMQAGDEIAFLPPVSGGATQAAEGLGMNVFALTRDVVRPEIWTGHWPRPEDGAVIFFEGVVRNNTKGRETTRLDYQCYEPMALRLIEQLGKEIAAQFELGRIAIVHRLGLLEVGETSVLIATSAPHRRQAFHGALEAIDRLKKEVPIWKKEFFADGEVWVDGDWNEALISQSAAETGS